MIDWKKITQYFLRLAVWAYKKSDESGRIKTAMEDYLRTANKVIFDQFEHYDRKLALRSEQLTRRYDPAAALNEAANRAIEQRRAENAPKEPQLTGKQLAALEFQRDYLRKIVTQ